MKYEIVNLEQKTIIGVSTTTSNQDAEMGKKIGDLWVKLYQGGINSKILNKVNEFAIGLYSDYKDGQFTVTAGNEVSKVENKDLTVKIIPKGKYAKFSVKGHMEKAVASAWAEIWQTPLDRSFTADFEEYLNSDYDNCNIDIYIGLN